MALRSGSMGSLLQGVSQQPDRVRLDGQVSEQTNMLSDVTRGLSTRPATGAGPSLSNADDHGYEKVVLDGDDYILGYKSGDLRMWGLDGTEQTLTYRNGATTSYIGDDMQFHVVDKQIVLLNRDKLVQEDATIEGRPFNAVLFHALGGQFLKTYSVTITFEDTTEITASYVAPDGTGANDAAETSSEYIIEQLVDELNTLSPPAGTVITRQDDVAQVMHPTQTVRITVSDGEGGEILRAISDTVQSVADLPRYASNGHIVKVTTSEADEDDYFLKFDAKDTDTEDGAAGFGEEGTWVEWYDPEATRLFDLTTMPHVIVEDTGAFYVEQGPWIGRQVGDSESAPFVSIIGKPLRDVEGFEGRLVLLSPDTVVMSRTNNPFDLWRQSATVSVATDPVDITSTKKDDLQLDWLIPLDRDMFIMADPGDSQFIIRGGGVDPETISMVLTTEFEISSGGTAPISTGRTILFPFKTGQFSGIKEFYTDSDNAANAANSLTETQDTYIEGSVTHMTVSQNFNLALFKTDSAPKRVWVYKYLWDGTEILQSSWSDWEFVDDVEYFFFDNSRIFFISKDIDGDVFIHDLDLNRPLGSFGYHEMLDRRSLQTVNADQYIDLPFDNAKFLQYTGCANPGLEALPVSSVRINSLTHRYYFSAEVAPEGANLRCGQPVAWSLQPTEVFARTYQGEIDTSRKITITDYVVHVDNSGQFEALGTSPYSDDWTYSEYTFPFDNEPLDPDRLLLHTGPVTIPWGERADWSTMTLYGNDVRPVTIHEVEWIGQILTTRGRRV